MTTSVDPREPTRGDLIVQLAALKGKFASLAAIEQAKGALMVTYGLTADAAFDLLRFHSQTRNLKLRAIAAQLTSLLSTSRSSTAAITQFDLLIDTVTKKLQTPCGATFQTPAAGPPITMASLLWQLTDSQAPQLAGRAVPAPGVTIAGNVPGLPLVYANDRFAELTGYPIGDVLGRNCRFLQGAATNPRDITTLSRALHTGRDVSVVMRNYRSDGSVFLNEVSVSPIRNPMNQITHFIGTQLDVTHKGRQTAMSSPLSSIDTETHRSAGSRHFPHTPPSRGAVNQ